MNTNSRNWESFALLLIDLQRDFWSDEMSQKFADYEKNVGELLKLCRREGLDIVHLRARFQQDQSDWMVKYRTSGRIPCIEGTPGVEIFPIAQDVPGEFVIYKQSFDGFHKPALQAYLQKNQKKFVLVAGLVTSVCVLLTAATAAQRGYLVGLVEDCCADSLDAHDHTMRRYPFIFDRTSVAQIVANHEKWLANVNNLADRKFLGVS